MARNFANVVQALSTEAANRPDLQQAFEQAVADARKVAPVAMDRHGIASLIDFYAYLNHLLTWIPREDSPAGMATEKISLFYLVVNQPSVLALQTPTSPRSWTSEWITDYVCCQGAVMDTSGPVAQETLAVVRQATGYRVDDYVEPEGGWKTFNEFLARPVKPACRPIAGSRHSSVLVSPADCTVVGSWPVDDRGTISFDGIPWGIDELLQESRFARRFRGGTFLHVSLSPTDYHRQHSPGEGTVLETKVIEGPCFLEVGPDGEGDLRTTRREGTADTPPGTMDGTGFQWWQTRGLVVQTTPGGLVAVLPVGTWRPESVVMTVQPEQSVQRGEEISYLQFGGSDLGLVLEGSSTVDLSVQPGQRLKMGEKIGEVLRPRDVNLFSSSCCQASGFGGQGRRGLGKTSS